MNTFYITVQVVGTVHDQASAEEMIQASLDLATQEMHDVQDDSGAESEERQAAEFFLNHHLTVVHV